jgi:hypothetical protein
MYTLKDDGYYSSFSSLLHTHSIDYVLVCCMHLTMLPSNNLLIRLRPEIRTETFVYLSIRLVSFRYWLEQLNPACNKNDGPKFNYHASL